MARRPTAKVAPVIVSGKPFEVHATFKRESRCAILASKTLAGMPIFVIARRTGIALEKTGQACYSVGIAATALLSASMFSW